MKIGFDAKRAFNNHTGLGNYSRDLIHGLNQYHQDFELHLYHPKANPNQFRELTAAPFHFHHPASSWGKLWRSKGIVKDLIKDKIDIYHGLSHELPYGIKNSGIKSVVTMHDLIVKKIPKSFNSFDRSIYKHKFKHAVNQADMIVSISESTKSDLIEIYQLNADKIVVIPPAIHDLFYQPISEEKDQELRKKISLPDRYFISVGSVIERKNMLRVVQALDIIPKPHRIPIIIIGKGNKYLQLVKQKVQELDMLNWVIFKENIEELDELKFYVKNAEAMVYPSLYEGFGMPCVEALCLETPVITSNISSLPEAAGSDSILIDPYSIESISNAMIQIIKQEIELDQMKKNGVLHAKKFTRKNTCKAIADLYQSM